MKAFCASIGFLASFFGVISIIITIATLKKTQSLFEAQMLIDFDRIYGDAAMSSALRTLRSFSEQGLNKYVFMNHRTEEHNPERTCLFSPINDFRWTSEVDKARRDVKFYFINTYDLYVEGKISKSIFLSIVRKSGITLFFDVVEQLEYLVNDKYDDYKFYHIMLLAGAIYTKQKEESAKNFDNPNRIKRIIEVPSENKLGIRMIISALVRQFCRSLRKS